ncbi:EAL domain-containing protein [Aliikangiella sp. IMCC44359]|uniref:EAL domain-containing protein n=1 Tax=Aliikangiella sp. IMCC44359 TaxID=3459125 RepID=UPI00403B1412
MLSMFLACFKALASYTVNLTQIDTDQGLNQSEIIGLMQDHDGYLWINSRQGINRYDGYRVTTIPSPDNILTNNYIELVFEDSYGLIWLGVAPQNNFYIDKNQNKLVSFKLTAPKGYKLEYPMLNRAAEDSQGNLWLATYREVFYFDRAKNKFQYVMSINELYENSNYQHSIRNLLIADNYLLIATSNELYALDVNTHKTHKVRHTNSATDAPDVKNVKSLLKTRSGKIIVGAVTGLFEIDPVQIDGQKDSEEYIGKQLIDELNIWQIIEKNNFLWLATNKGLYKYYNDARLEFIFKYSDTKFKTSDDNIIAMIEDREGNLWFGSRSDGIFKWHPNESIEAHYWTGSPVDSQISDDQILSSEKAPDNTIWIGTKNGLNHYDPSTKKIKQYLVNPDKKAVYSESTIYSIAYNQGNLWLNTEFGLRVFDTNLNTENKKLFSEELRKLFATPIYSIHFFDQKNLALFNKDGMYIYNIESRKLNLVESSKTNQDIKKEIFYIFSTATGERDSYYISGVERLVKYSHQTGLITNFHQLPPSSNLRTSPADVYRDGDKLWITYSNYGIYILDANTGEEIKFISEKELGTNTLMDIFPDKFGNLWFTSNKGLLRMNMQTYQSRLFDSKEGFATSEFMGATKLPLDDHKVILGSVKGFVKFSPNELTNKLKRNISSHITGLSLLTRKIDYQFRGYDNYQLELNHDDFGVKIEFSALLFDRPKQVKYQYWVDGVSAIEPTILNKSELFLASFKSGKSTLNISAIDYETGKKSPPTKITIITNPAPWLSIQAYTSYILVSILLISFYYHRFRQREKAKALAHQKLQHSEERLNLALKGSNSGLWDWHAENNTIYEPRISHSQNNGNGMIPFEQRLEAIHPEDRENFKNAWDKFLAQGKLVFNHVYRMKDQSEHWIWYRDMATVSKRNQKNRASRVTGTYTNITKRKRDRDRMRLYSKAFENTRDIVFVLDDYKNVIAANQSFYKKTKREVDEIIGHKIDFIVDNNGNNQIIEKIFKNIETGSHWESEGNLLQAKKKPIPILINATSFSIGFKQENYVFALTDISNQKSAEAELRKLANYDSLTGLPNRTLLLDRIKHAIDHCRRRSETIAIFFIDLDRFKRINDTLGHDVGDLLLSKVAKILIDSVREDDTVARIGGDEFVVMLEDIDGLSAISRIALGIIEKMKNPIKLHENQIAISPSIGIAIYPNNGFDPEQLLKHADIAMYHAKKAGRNNFQYYESSMNKTAHNRLLLENKLRRGLDNNEFYLVYQPQYDITTGQLIGMEGLARWKTIDNEIITPSEFIPLAEDLGLIITMSEKLLTQAISNLSQWHEKGISVALAFNLSARHLHHYDLIEFLDQLLIKYPIKPELLEFELTESVLMEDTSRAQMLFDKLAERGIELALDDFGTGYSSLRYLSQLPIKKLKIDRSFVSKIGESKDDEAIIHTIISLAKSLKLKTVAEGIETKEQLDFLKAAGARDAQGYYFSKPLALSEIEILLCQGVFQN